MTTHLADLNPDTAGAELEISTQSMVRRLGTATVLTSTADLEQAVMDRTAIGEAIRNVEGFFEEPKRLAHRMWQLLCTRERTILAPLKAVDADRKAAISAYKEAEDRARQAREREQAEIRRREAEAQATAEAAALESAGQPEVAAAVLAEALVAPAPVVSLPDATKGVEGLKFRRRWCWRYAGGPRDVAATPAAVQARALAMIPREFLTLDETKVGAYARAMKAAGKIPGIEIYAVDDPVR